jgi:ribosome biogenesis protein BRX1
MEKDPEQPNGPIQTSLVEIGPRFVMTPIKIFEGAFNGATVFSNPGARARPALPLCYSHRTPSLTVTCPIEFVSPAAVRSAVRKAQGQKYRIRKGVETERKDRKETRRRPEDELAVSKVFA